MTSLLPALLLPLCPGNAIHAPRPRAWGDLAELRALLLLVLTALLLFPAFCVFLEHCDFLRTMALVVSFSPAYTQPDGIICRLAPALF